MSGECFEHDLQWYSGGIECPLCALTSERDRLAEALKEARVEIDAWCGLHPEDVDQGDKKTLDMIDAALDKDA